MLGERIRAARKRSGLTQEQLATQLRVKRAVISKYETGLIEPSVTQLRAIATVLEVSLSDLVGIEPLVDTTEHGTAMDDGIGGGLAVVNNAFKVRIDHAMPKLNEVGQKEAAKRVEELTEISRYQRRPESQESTLPPSDVPEDNEG